MEEDVSLLARRRRRPLLALPFPLGPARRRQALPPLRDLHHLGREAGEKRFNLLIFLEYN